MSGKRKALEEEEEAFPRGRPSADADVGDDDGADRAPRVPPKGDKTRRKRAKTAAKPEGEEEDETTTGITGAVQIEAPKHAARLRPTDLVEGTMLMAAVREVHDDEITLNLPFNVTGYVSRAQATEPGEPAAQLPPLSEAYPIGRFVVAVVTAVVEVGKTEAGKTKKLRVELSLRPSLANAGLTAEDITPHMWLPAVVESEEEHVFKLGFGVSGLQGLLKKSEALKLGKLPSPGMVVQVGVQSSNTAAGIIRCTATTMESLGSSPLKLESLKVGFLVHARIEKLLPFAKAEGPEGFSNNGAVASFCGSLTGVINWHYQGQGATAGPELARKQRVTARVLAIVPGPKTLVHLALLPHLLDWTSQSELLTGVNIGDRVDGHVLDLLPKYGCRLRCTRQGANLPLLAFCPSARLTESEDAAETPAGLSSGSKTLCRVLAYNFFDAALVVTRRRDDLKEDTLVSVTELSAGQLVVGEITRLAEYGVFVRLSEFITSMVHLRQLTDVPLATVPSRFQVGTKVKCRVLRVFPEKRQAVLTAKKALVKGDFQLNAFEKARQDMLVTGYVSKVQPYGAIVNFFGDVHGLLPAKEMEKDEAPALGMAVHCRISNVNKKRRRLALSVDLANGKAPSDLAGSPDMDALEHGAWPPGSIASLQVVECIEEGVIVKLRAAKGKAGDQVAESDAKGFIPLAHLSDDMDQAKARHVALRASIGDAEAEGALTLGTGVVLARRFHLGRKGSAADADGEEEKENAQRPAMVLVSVKPSLRLAVDDGAFVTDLAQLQGQAPRLYTGYVKYIHEAGVIVSVGGWHIKGLAPKHQISEDYVENPSEMYAPGQTVRALVAKVEIEKKRFQVNLRLVTTTLNDAELLRREAEALRMFFKLQATLSSRDGAKEVSSSLLPGSVLDATVTSVKSYGVLMNLAGHKGMTALALKANIPEGQRLHDGEKIKCTVLDLDVKSNIVDVSLQPELLAVSSSGSQLQPTSNTNSKKRRRTEGGDYAEVVNSGEPATSMQELNVMPALQKPAYAVLWSKEPPAVLFAPPWEKQSWKFPRPAMVHSVPSEPSFFKRILARCPHGGAERQPRRKVPRITNPEKLQVGSAVTMRVVSVKGLEVLCQAPGGMRGHVHAAQFGDQGPVGSGGQMPLANLQKKDVLDARILQVQQREKLWHLELTCRPALQTTRDTCDYEAVDMKWSTLTKGQHVSAAVASVRKNFLWVEVAHGIQGRINSLDASTDMNVVRDLNKSFQQGQVYEALVLGVVSSKKSLDLILHGNVQGPAPEGRTLARLEKIEDIKGKGIAATFQLPGRRHGFVHVTELYDFWAQFPLRRLKPGHIYEASVIRGAVSEQGGKAEISLRDSHVHGQNVGPEEARPLTAADLKKGQRVSGYVVNSNEKGVFVALSRSLVARIQLKALSDQVVLKDKVAHLHPPGELIRQAVVVAVDSARGFVDLSLRKADSGPKLTVEQMSVGDILSGRVKAVEKYGLFVRLDNSTVDALVHKTDISDSASVSIDSYQPGSMIPRAKVVKIENGKVWLGIKASLFEAGELQDEDEDLDEDDALDAGDEDAIDDQGGETADDDQEPATPVKVAKKAKKAELDDSDDEVPWDRTSAALAKADATDSADVFQFAEFKSKQVESEDEEEDGSGDEDPEKKRPSKRQKKAMKLAEAKEVQQEEADNAEGRWATDPRSVEDFERLLLTEGDTSIVWIRYMAFHLKMSDLERARQVAERAVKHVGFAEGKERFNAWVAYMNLECTFGTDQTADAIFRRASSHNDAKQVHLQLARIHERNSKLDLAVRAHEACCKKFPQSKKVWLAYLSCLYHKQDLDAGRKALPKCLASVPRRKHPVVVSKAALLEYQHGTAERGRSVFEGLLDSYPKRTDLWSIYIDAHIKAHTPPKVAKPEFTEVRRLLERCCTMKLKAAKMRFFFKKWLDFEKKFGDAESQELVRSKAREFVEAQAT